MNKLVLPLLGACLLAGTPAYAAGDAPSSEAQSAAKTAKEASNSFDPQTYTCKHFNEDLMQEAATERLGVAVIWAHGYFSSAFGTDDMGPLSEASVAEIVQDFVEYCDENKNDTFSRATYKLSEDTEED